MPTSEKQICWLLGMLVLIFVGIVGSATIEIGSISRPAIRTQAR